ncbi:ArnT family glycosyltransferase [Pleurocapsa sp. FMAR1]|uniref:ArnT family glycosyltransferase n=1 Tax=Pleurocapsa sp. FMAR1 TaxID=3040204 RepID=UPI0029C7D080|nr:glycosyltransferase family 39 protein [Pleurocapsa sp. FMAR1]
MKQERYLYLTLAIALILLLINLNSWGVLEASEARYAEISREMFRSGNLLQPTLLNIFHFHKPPVTFWLTDLGFELFGINAFGARFFLQFSLILQGILIYLISQRLFAVRVRSILAVIIYLSFPLSIMSARNLTTDNFLTTLVLAVIYAMTVYYCQRQVWGIYAAALFVGIGFLTKGPAIFVVPFFYWFYLLIARRVNYRVPIKHLVISLILCLTLGLSWYVVVAQQLPSLTDYFLGRQLADRVLDAETFDRTEPGWYYLLIFSTTTLPWFFIYIASLFRPGYRLVKNVDARQLSFYWLLLPFIIFSLTSSKLMMYLLPIYPGLAMILAGLITEMNNSDLKWFTKMFIGFYWLLGAIALFAPFFISVSGADLTITWQMIISALFIFALPILIYRLVKHDSRLRLSAIALFSMLTFIVYGGYLIGANELSFGGTRPIAKFIQAQELEDEPVLVYNKLLPSLAFNLDRDIITLNDGGVERETQFQTNDQWKRFWIDIREPTSVEPLRNLVQSPSVLVTKNKLPDQWSWITQSYNKSKSLGKWTIYYQS